MKVTELYRYPVKSCGGLAQSFIEIDTRGFVHDRQWMVVDSVTGMFVSQRSDRGLGIEVKIMCKIRPNLTPYGNLILHADGEQSLNIGSASYTIPVLVQVWKSKVLAKDAGDEAAEWLSRFLSKERPGQYRLVRFDEEQHRKAKYGTGEVSFADACPFLFISRSSLDDLNKRINGEVLRMDRFRPSIVFDGCDAYAEDRMKRVRIGNVEFVGEKLCVRCPLTMTNQDTAARGKEPLRTLNTYRKNPYPGENGVVFGRNFNNVGTGMIKIGDEVEVLEWD